MLTRSTIVAAARGFLGTPYHHQGALAGAGCDCLGLVRGVWRALYGAEPEAPPPYTADWGEVAGEAGESEPLIEAARRHLAPLPLAEAGPGDVLLFRLRPHLVAKHVAILTGSARMIHAQSGDQVREIVLTTGWRRRTAAAFAFPGREG